MKRELSIEKPEGLKDLFPGQFTMFSWLDSAVTAPTLITLITTRKANGRPNACLHAWGMLLGGHGNYSSLIAVAKRGHTYANIVRERQWCVCIPPWRLRQQCFATIQCNGEENDEITDAGFAVEKAAVVKAPRDESVMVSDIATKLERMESMCSVPCALNPLTAELSSNMGFAKFILWDDRQS